MDYALSQITQEWNRRLLDPDASFLNSFLTRRKAEYLLRLFFAVTVDSFIVHCMEGRRAVDSRNVADAWNLVAHFRDYSPDSACAQAKELLSSLPERSGWEALRAAWEKPLSEMGALLASRDGSPDTVRKIEECITRAEALTDGKFFSYRNSSNTPYTHRLLMVQNASERKMISLINNEDEPFRQTDYNFLSKNETREDHKPAYPLRRRLENNVNYDPMENQLYLIVDSSSPAECYRLSPFLLWDESNGILLYDGVEQSLNHYADLQYQPLLPPEGGAGRKTKVIKPCGLASLIPDGLFTDSRRYRQYLISSDCRRMIEINLPNTQNPDAQEALGKPEEFKYCERICPQASQVEEFCAHMPGPTDGNCCVINGEGGLGKTALAFHIINERVLKGRTEYTRVVFLSAKETQVNYDRSVQNQGDAETLLDEEHRDFTTYQGFLVRLFELFAKHDETPPESESDLEDAICDLIHSNIPNTLLVVDDLDSLKNLNQQQKLMNLIHRFHGAPLYALITTRNREMTGGANVTLERLNGEDSVYFLEWYLDSLGKKGLGRRLCANLNPEKIRQITEGRPYDLKHCAKLLQENLPIEPKFDVYLTPRHKTLYLCRTSFSQMGPRERTLFHFICAFNSALYGKRLGEEGEILKPLEISRRFLHMMQMPDLESVPALRDAQRKLQLYYLLTIKTADESAGSLMSHDIFCEIRRDLVYGELFHDMSLSPYLERLLEDVRKNPDNWKVPHWTQTLLDYLRSQYHLTYTSGTDKRRGKDEDRIVAAMREYKSILTGEQKRILNGMPVPMLESGRFEHGKGSEEFSPYAIFDFSDNELVAQFRELSTVKIAEEYKKKWKILNLVVQERLESAKTIEEKARAAKLSESFESYCTDPYM